MQYQLYSCGLQHPEKSIIFFCFGTEGLVCPHLRHNQKFTLYRNKQMKQKTKKNCQFCSLQVYCTCLYTVHNILWEW
uniref:Uncharacterized protein n=1 Tax=Anguilla anguilla TaxID=7936 RepID=A0A0E9X7C3_ANGAN